MDLKEKVILITGSTAGIGRTTALRFAQEGAIVVINGRKGIQEGEELVRQLEAQGARALFVQADVSRIEDIERLFKTVMETFGRLDILINNAAIASDPVSYEASTQEDFMLMFQVNLIGPMMCAQQAIKIMQAQGGGKILNTSSVRGCEYAGNRVTYAATKAGLNSFTKTLAKRVAPQIQVNAVAPGFVKTRTFDKKTPEELASYADQVYLKRWITEDEIADAFLFLAKNDGMTGQIIYVDGGFTLK